MLHASHPSERRIVVNRLNGALSFSICRMYWLCLAALAATAAAQSSYDLESRVSFPGKSSSLGPLYSSGLGGGQGFRDNSYEDNIVTPTPSPTPAYRNPSSQQPKKKNQIFLVLVYDLVSYSYVSFLCNLYRKPSLDQTAIRVNGPPRGSIVRGGQPQNARDKLQDIIKLFTKFWRISIYRKRNTVKKNKTSCLNDLGVTLSGLKDDAFNCVLNLKEVEELEEKEEPDRLTLLLPQSKFDCVNKQTGYYADEDLNCEVFHYCQDNARHSWICPEGFTFHQVHLICMPPSGDINCKKSSQYHFVNEYLYKPLNLAEAETKPNVTLRYSERFFPADIHPDEREVGDYQITPSAPIRRPTPPVYASPQPATLNSIPSSARPQPTGFPQFRLPVNQVFRSPEEVNIPLQHRRPQPQHQTSVRRYPQVRPDDEEYE
ncbi:hypothetical protein E2986_12701 [Frieseomelitta varia]|uniref:Chitin-binding type-2 domain-containing protein n=1 Tax=Frieseomelitta varia TaxID=561572 RepID=A0A833RWY6_9HYME|nr:hypothetical protein E2986_12701 [Frieseomelitta varia]